MPKTNFIVGTTDGNYADIGDLLVPRSFFSEGGMWLWGQGGAGQRGDNTSTSIRSSPVQTVAGGTNWKNASSGFLHSAGIKTDGTLWTWGYNAHGSLGDNTVTSKSSPVQTVAFGTNWKQVGCGTEHTAAIKSDGTLWICGYNLYGQIGDNSTTNRSSPVQTVSSTYNWKQVNCGAYHTAAIKTDGTLWSWGYNLYGVLGDSSTTNRSSPVQTMSGDTTWKQVSCGDYFTVAIKTDGTLWGWGFNGNGQLGDSTTTNYSSPVQTITVTSDWKLANAGTSHTGAIKTDGTLWLWGANASGQLGTNNLTGTSSPIQTITYANNWKDVRCGNALTVALKTDGTLWNWGSNNLGQLGDSTTAAKSSPIQTIAGGSNWRSIFAGNMQTIGLKDDM